METFFIKALQLILSFSILVAVHEFGHFIFARIFKVRVEKAYLFFDPWFSLFKYKSKKNHTEYGIGWLPLGGYVKLSGMMDESMDKEQMAQPPKPWEFRTKPAWQRLIIMAAGVIFNFILATLILSMIVFSWGDSYLPLKNVGNGMSFSQQAIDAGFRDRDVLVSADGKDLVLRGSVLDMNTLIQFLDAEEVVVVREGVTRTITLPEDFGNSVISSKDTPYEFWASTKVDSVLVGGEAHNVGLVKGDSLVAVNGKSVTSYAQLRKGLQASKNDSVTLSYMRFGELHNARAYIDSTALLGFSTITNILKDDYKHDEYGFFASFPMGVGLGVNTLKAYVAQMRFVFNKEGVKNLGGFGAIGNMFPAQWDWHSFWTMTAFLSVVLAFMNILPIPALDGGHIMFLLYEMVTRRQPNEKFMEYAQITGMVLLFSLLIFANVNDLIRAIFG